MYILLYTYYLFFLCCYFIYLLCIYNKEGRCFSEVTINTINLSVSHSTVISFRHLEGNQISIIKEKAFYGLSALPTLNLKQQEIKYIAEGAFRGLRKLSNLVLSNNKIEVLYQGTFQDLTKLTHL